MNGSGTVLFTDPADYGVDTGGVKANFVFTQSKNFKARVTWAKLPNVHLVRGEENLPRSGFIALSQRPLFVGFSTRFDPPPVWGGVELQSGDILFQRGGDRIHQWSRGPNRWAFISFDRKHLATCAKALLGRELSPPSVGRIMRTSLSAMTQLRRLHASVCRLAETKPELIAQPEVIRAIEHDVLYAIISCLSAADLQDGAIAIRRHTIIMNKLEDELATRNGVPLRMSELSATIGAPERTVRTCCAQFLGMAPCQYFRLRRLQMVRAVLRQADPAPAGIAETARSYGFCEPGRFAGVYRTAFGEVPSATLRAGRSTARGGRIVGGRNF